MYVIFTLATSTAVWIEQLCLSHLSSPDTYQVTARHSGRTSVSRQQTFLVLRSACIAIVGKPSTTGQPTRPTQPFTLSGSINE